MLPVVLVFAALLLPLGGGGCVQPLAVIPPSERKPIDAAVVETPAGYTLVPLMTGLTAPNSICFDNEEGDHKGTLLIAESGAGGHSVRIVGVRPDDTVFDIYPQFRRIPFIHRGFEIYGPIGGMVVSGGTIIVSHRDRNGMGVITALGYDGSHRTLVADLPAQGDYGVTDLAVNPINGRIFFGVGAATNSGVVGLDNWAAGWANDHPKFCDQSYVAIKSLGLKFDTKNPRAGLWGGPDRAVTGPFQPFNSSSQLRIPPAPNGKPGAAIYSMSPMGGDLRVEGHGIRLPRGLAFNGFGALHFTDNGMELRGTRPVKDDPDVLAKLTLGSEPTWYGWPDHSADLEPIGQERFQPPIDMVLPSGYPEISPLLDQFASKLSSPTRYRSEILRAIFPSQSGAAKMDFAPTSGPFKNFADDAIIALSGDRAPFATGGRALVGPMGYKIVRVNSDPTRKQVNEFVRNTSGKPASLSGGEGAGKGSGSDWAMERPIDVKFGPDGALYILDLGRMTVVNGKEKIAGGTGRVYKLVPIEWTTTGTTTRPTTAP
jgi:hypothetical protein